MNYEKELQKENTLWRRCEKMLGLSMKLNPIDINDEETILYLENVGNGKKIAKDFKLIKEMFKAGCDLNKKIIYKGRTFKDILKTLDRINHALEASIKED